MHVKLLIALIALSCAACQPSHNLGYTSARVQVDGRQPISLSIWYPTESGETGVVAQSDIFQGQRASRGAPPLPSQHPLVLLSHGDSSTNRNHGSWLSARLARSGFIVVEFGPTVDEENSEVDLSCGYHASFAHMRNDPIWHSRIDFDQIAVVGFGYTGATVLSSFDEVVGVPAGESPCPVDRSPDSRGCEFSTVSNPAADGLTEGATLSQEPLNSMVRAVVALIRSSKTLSYSRTFKLNFRHKLSRLEDSSAYPSLLSAFGWIIFQMPFRSIYSLYVTKTRQACYSRKGRALLTARAVQY